MILLLLTACAPNPGAAFRLAAAGDPAAPNACLALSDPSLSGDCIASYIAIVPDPAVCAQVMDPTWRGECYFVLAEQAMKQHNVEAAFNACHQSEPFIKDCARHIWKQSFQEDPSTLDAIIEKLKAEFPNDFIVNPQRLEDQVARAHKKRQVTQATRTAVQPALEMPAGLQQPYSFNAAGLEN